MGTPATWIKLSSNAQQLTMRWLVLCFALLSFPPNLRSSGSVVYLLTIYSFKTPLETELE